MTVLFQNKYRIPSNRLEGYDYSSDGFYFVTMCTKNREYYFGDVVGGEMVLSEMGEVIYDEIVNIQNHRKNVILDEFVVMPDHVHLIIFLKGNGDGEEVFWVDSEEIFWQKISTGNVINTQKIGISTGTVENTKKIEYQSSEYFKKISPKTNSLGNIIKLLKGYVTKRIKKAANQ